MLVILSGCDRSGKTTIAEGLCKKFPGSAYMHFSHPASKELAKKEYYDFIDNINPSNTYIVDRFYECEYVYAPIYRNYELDYQKEIEKKILTKTNALYIYVQAPMEVIVDRIRSVGEDYVQGGDIPEVIRRYEDFINKVRLPYMILDNSFANIDENIELCYQKILLANGLQSVHRKNKERIPVGNINAKIMVVDPAISQFVTSLPMRHRYWFTSNEDPDKLAMQPERILKKEAFIL